MKEGGVITDYHIDHKKAYFCQRTDYVDYYVWELNFNEARREKSVLSLNFVCEVDAISSPVLQLEDMELPRFERL